MKILITGTRGLAYELSKAYANHEVMLVGRSNGFDINDIDHWGHEFVDYDCVFNCAYDGFAQVNVLEFFYNQWKQHVNKQIVSIGSRVISFKRSESELGYWAYRLHKQALQQAHDSMLLDAKCDMKIINPGPVDTDMIRHLNCVKLDTAVLANTIKNIAADTTVKRVDLWA
jgi:short-subunit dehydrogenase